MNIAQILNDALLSVTPIVSQPLAPLDTQVTNVQSTTRITDDDQELSLIDIVIAFPGMLKYTSKFAAIVMHSNFGVHPTACMVFKIGKLVVVGALTFEHSRYAAQMYRRLIESAFSAHFTKFLDFQIGNWVANSRLPYTVDPKALRDTKQRDARYTPEAFPGCRLLVWVRPRGECRCVKKAKANKECCACNVKSTVFDTGTFIITGSKSIADINRAKHAVHQFTQPHRLADAPAVPKDKRYEMRRQAILDASYLETGLKPVKKKRKMDETALAGLLAHVPTLPTLPREPGVPLFIYACRNKQIDLLRTLVAIGGPHYLREAIEYFETSAQGEFEAKILAALQKNVLF
jgi:TATA-box binding protein (TBP) (component of TFIID and TFIIIB)